MSDTTQSYQLDLNESRLLEQYVAEARARAKGFREGLEAGKELFIRCLVANKKPITVPDQPPPAPAPVEGEPNA